MCVCLGGQHGYSIVYECCILRVCVPSLSIGWPARVLAYLSTAVLKKLLKLSPQSRLLKQLTRAYHAHALGANGQAASGGVDREGRVRARSSSPPAACAPCLGTRLSGSRAGSDSLWRTGVVRRQLTQAELATARSPQRVREQLLSTDSSNRLLIRPRCSNRPSGKLGARTW